MSLTYIVLLVAFTGAASTQQLLVEEKSLMSFIGTLFLILFIQLPGLILYRLIIYPLYLSPFLKLPQAPQSRSWRKLLYEPTAADCLDWIQAIPNNGLLRYLGVLNSERILVTNTRGIAEVLQTKPYEFEKSPAIRKLLVMLLGEGLVVAEGEKHKYQRKHLTTAFSFRMIRDLYPVFWDKASEYVVALEREVLRSSTSEVKPSAAVDIVEWNQRVTLDIICMAGFGNDPKVIENPNSDWYRQYRLGFVPTKEAKQVRLLAMMLPGAVLNWLPLKRVKDIQIAQSAVKTHIKKILAEKKVSAGGDDKGSSDMISRALQTGAFSEADLLDQSMTFIAAGHETTSVSLSWSAYMLAQKSDIQSRLREEIRARLPSPSQKRCMSAESLDSLPYLHAFCNEILRLYTPIPMLHRSAASDTTVLGTRIPKGTNLRVSSWAVSQAMQFWGETAHEFVPQRWLEGERASKGGAESNYSFMAFSHGARNCIGSSFARAEFAACLACLVGRFDIKLEKVGHDGVLRVNHGITAKIDGGLHVRLTPLEGW